MQSQRCLLRNELINRKQRQGPSYGFFAQHWTMMKKNQPMKVCEHLKEIVLVWGDFPVEYHPRQLKKRLEHSGELPNRTVCVWCWWVHEVFCGCFVFSVAQFLNCRVIKTDHYHKGVLFLYLLKIECTWL